MLSVSDCITIAIVFTMTKGSGRRCSPWIPQTLSESDTRWECGLRGHRRYQTLTDCETPCSRVGPSDPSPSLHPSHQSASQVCPRSERAYQIANKCPVVSLYRKQQWKRPRSPRKSLGLLYRCLRFTILTLKLGHRLLIFA